MEDIKSNKYVRNTSRGIPKAEAVEPIRSLTDIELVKRYLKKNENKRDYCLFVIGINVGLRASDLLSLKIGDVLEKDQVIMYEQKTNKKRIFGLNQSCKDAIEFYLKTRKDYTNEDYLFESRKSKEASSPLNPRSTHKIIKSTLRELGIEGNFGTHTLRKTFCYHVYLQNVSKDPAILATLQEMLNHTSPKTTLRYMGVTQDIIGSIYQNLNL